MRGSETAALGPVPHQDIDPGGVIGVITGPEAPDILFDDGAAHKIGEDDGTCREGDPPPARFTVIDGSKEQQEKIERHPHIGIAQPGHQPGEEGVMPLAVDDPE